MEAEEVKEFSLRQVRRATLGEANEDAESTESQGYAGSGSNVLDRLRTGLALHTGSAVHVDVRVVAAADGPAVPDVGERRRSTPIVELIRFEQ